MTVEDEILRKLTEIEQKENVRILYAAESGSRAWGFASPDSDYDVRFIYVRRKEDYLRLDNVPDVIEWQLDDVYDINGWDLKKALTLLYKSNPALFEWNGSPIVYRTGEHWTSIQKEINSFFISKSGLYHYLHMAEGNYREYLKGETVKLKKYLYVLRPVLAARWIIERNCPPPVKFADLADAMLEPSMRGTVDALLEAKMHTPELGEGRRIPELNDYLDRSISELKELAGKEEPAPAASWDRLNEIFISVIEGD